MTIPATQNPIPKTVALVLVALCLAWLMKSYVVASLAKLDSMSPEDCLQHQRHLHQHSYLVQFITMLVLGGFYLGVVEVITYVIRLVIPKKADV